MKGIYTARERERERERGRGGRNVSKDLGCDENTKSRIQKKMADSFKNRTANLKYEYCSYVVGNYYYYALQDKKAVL